MTDKQIIIDGVKITKKDFVDNFAIELTNRNIEQREQIGNKYFDIIQAKEQECEEIQKALAKCWIENGRLKKECEELKNFHINLVGVKECEIKELLKLKQTLAEIKKLVEKEFCRHIECCEFCAISNECVNQKIIEKINEVENGNI